MFYCRTKEKVHLESRKRFKMREQCMKLKVMKACRKKRLNMLMNKEMQVWSTQVMTRLFRQTIITSQMT